jgi:hypothetical protein
MGTWNHRVVDMTEETTGTVVCHTRSSLRGRHADWTRRTVCYVRNHGGVGVVHRGDARRTKATHPET